MSQCHWTNSLRCCSSPPYVSSDRRCLARGIPGVGQNLWEKGGCGVLAMQSSPGRPRCYGVGRKPTSPAQRQETRTTWAASEPHRHLMLAPKAVRLGLHSLAARHGAGGPVLCPLFAKRGGGNADPRRWGVSPFGFAAPVLQCLKEEAADRAPGLCSSFCRESTVHPSSGACPGSGCQCPGVVHARNKGSSWAVARCLRPGPRSQTQPWRDSCAGVCSCRCFPEKKGLAVFMAGLFPPAFEVSQQPS